MRTVYLGVIGAILAIQLFIVLFARRRPRDRMNAFGEWARARSPAPPRQCAWCESRVGLTILTLYDLDKTEAEMVELVCCCEACMRRYQLDCVVHMKMACAYNPRAGEEDEVPVVGVCPACAALEVGSFSKAREYRLQRTIADIGHGTTLLDTAERIAGGAAWVDMDTAERLIYGLILASRLCGLSPEEYLERAGQRLIKT